MASKNVSVIPARSRFQPVNEVVKKMRVCAYCRVSTDSEEQLLSYDAQVSHYTEYINKNPEWEMVKIYADSGISATNTKKRIEFNNMIEDCMAGKVDMIITKSISRFARNTLDCLKYIRQLKDKGIPVYFEKENINTMDSKGEILLTIMSSLAQEESRSLSQNVKMGIAYRYQNGEVQVNHNRFLGYTKDENGHLIIDPVQAEVVKRIFREYLEGASLLSICRGLEADHILTAAGKIKWRPESVKKLLMNEKFMGDALLQKTYTVDFLTKKRVVNNGIVPQYYVENNHEAIIPKELYFEVQEEIKRRSNLKRSTNGKKQIYSSKFALSSIVYCGECGEIYRRVHWNNRGKKSVVWRCVSRLEDKTIKCQAPTILEKELQDIVIIAINQIITCKDGFIQTLKNNINTVLNATNDSNTDSIDEKLDSLQNEMLHYAKMNARDGVNSTKYDKKYEELADNINDLRTKKQNIEQQNTKRQCQRTRIGEMTAFLQVQETTINDYDDKLVRMLVEKILVNNDLLHITFKSGLELDIEWKKQ